jgi:formiminotetrahydrofolate cyclodeaminase
MSPEFLRELAQARPDPGGGAAAAYAARVGLALIEKVIKLELGRQGNQDQGRQFWEEQLTHLGGLVTEMAHLQEADVQAYAALSRAWRNRSQPEELLAAVEQAIGCPHGIIARAEAALHLGGVAGDSCRPHLLADLLVAVELLGAAIQGAYHIAAANLPLLGAEERCREYREKLTQTNWQGWETLLKVRIKLTANSGGSNCHPDR